MAARKKTAEPSATLPAYVVHGKDDFLRGRRLASLIKSLIGDDTDTMALASYDGGSAALIDILDDVRTPSLLAPLRVVVVRDADGLFGKGSGDDDGDAQSAAASLLESGKKKGSKAASFGAPLPPRELLERYLDHPVDTGVLILECRSWPKTTRLYKIVDKLGGNFDCDPPKGDAAYESFIRQHAREEFDCKLTEEAVVRLLELVGDNTGFLHMELSKLATYVAPGREIKVEDVDALAGETRVEIVFKIVDAIAARNAQEALSLWHQVLASDRSAAFTAVGGLRYSLSRLAEAKRLQGQGMSIFDIKKSLRIWDRENTLPQQLRQFSLAQWQGMLGKLLRIDLGSKTGVGDVEMLIEKFIVETCAAA